MFKKYRSKFKPYEDADTQVRKEMSDPYRNLSPEFLPTLMKKLATIELIRNEDGKVSTKATLLNVTDDETKAAMMIAFECPRSRFIRSGKKNPELASLTPLLMYAHKKKDGIMYNDWDATDPMINYALGTILSRILDEPTIKFMDTFREHDLEDILVARKEYCGDNPSDGYFSKMAKLKKMDSETLVKLPANHPAGKMCFQTWLAHPSYRMPGVMILDPEDWDNVPVAFDIVNESGREMLPW